MKIACKKSEKGGFGVFATDFIKENELIEDRRGRRNNT